MKRKVNALKKLAVAMGYGSDVTEYKGTTVVAVMKELAVEMNCAESVADIDADDITGVMKYIANNQPYDLSTKVLFNGDEPEDPEFEYATFTITRNGETVPVGSNAVRNGDVLTITATCDEDSFYVYSLTVNGVQITSGDTFTVNGGDVNIVADVHMESTLIISEENCTVTVTRNGVSIPSGTKLHYGDELYVSAVPEEGYRMESNPTINDDEIEEGQAYLVDDGYDEIVVSAYAVEEDED